MSLKQQVVESYESRYGRPPAFVVRAPGRVNVIGEHTDYNDGFVLPMAIQREVWIAGSPRDDGRVQIASLDAKALDQPDISDFELNRLEKQGRDWAEYIKGVAWILQQEGIELCGWDGVSSGDVPIGAGLSSSAALEMAAARAFAVAARLNWDPVAMAQRCQQAENQWVGVNCGIMDQLISATGRAGHAVLIDCRSLDLQPVPLPPGTAVVVLDTATRRGLVGSAYNERRQQCEAAAAHFGVSMLRDVSLDEFRRREGELDATTAQRARHVVTENARTSEAAEAMRAGDAERLGRLMDESHRSLRDDFQVSSKELDLIVELARAHDGCVGARMTGAGFGGCAVALVDADRAEAFGHDVSKAYEQQAQLRPSVYVCEATDGAQEVAEAGQGTTP